MAHRRLGVHNLNPLPSSQTTTINFTPPQAQPSNNVKPNKPNGQPRPNTPHVHNNNNIHNNNYNNTHVNTRQRHGKHYKSDTAPYTPLKSFFNPNSVFDNNSERNKSQSITSSQSATQPYIKPLPHQSNNNRSHFNNTYNNNNNINRNKHIVINNHNSNNHNNSNIRRNTHQVKGLPYSIKPKSKKHNNIHINTKHTNNHQHKHQQQQQQKPNINWKKKYLELQKQYDELLKSKQELQNNYKVLQQSNNKLITKYTLKCTECSNLKENEKELKKYLTDVRRRDSAAKSVKSDNDDGVSLSNYSDNKSEYSEIIPARQLVTSPTQSINSSVAPYNIVNSKQQHTKHDTTNQIVNNIMKIQKHNNNNNIKYHLNHKIVFSDDDTDKSVTSSHHPLSMNNGSVGIKTKLSTCSDDNNNTSNPFVVPPFGNINRNAMQSPSHDQDNINDFYTRPPRKNTQDDLIDPYALI